MFQIQEKQNELLIDLSATLSLMSKLIAPCTEYLRRFHLAYSDDLALVLRELVRNAIVHGSRLQEQQLVHISLRYLGPAQPSASAEVLLVVRDEGDGFCYSLLDLTLPETITYPCGRGLKLVNAIADELHFNACGNEVTARISMPRQEEKPFLMQ